jgi:hypothetical protein
VLWIGLGRNPSNPDSLNILIRREIEEENARILMRLIRGSASCRISPEIS